jgi:hypothetical protein
MTDDPGKQHPIAPIEIERNGKGSPQPIQHDEKGEAREEQQLQLCNHVRAGIRLVGGGIGKQAVQRPIENAQAHAQQRKKDHREAHVERRIGWPQSGILLKEHEPGELDPGVPARAKRRTGARPRPPGRSSICLQIPT